MTDHKLQVVPLGGLGEFGMNMTAIRYGDDMIIVDCGMMFPRLNGHHKPQSAATESPMPAISRSRTSISAETLSTLLSGRVMPTAAMVGLP